MGKRESSIELARIIGCIIVVSLHCLCIFYASTNITYLFKAFLLNGVPLFWFITGYFLFDGRGGGIPKESLMLL